MPRIDLAPDLDSAAAARSFPRIYGPKSAGALIATIAASASATFVTQVQSGAHFLLRSLTAQFTQNDWSFNVTFSAYQRSLFDEPILGAAHVFGQFDVAAAATRWAHGYEFAAPVLVPANSNVTVTVVNGSTGSLTISWALHGEDRRAGIG